MGITAHWVSDNWDLRSIGLAMFPLKGSHTGSNIKESFIEVIDLKFDLLKKVWKGVLEHYFFNSRDSFQM